MSYFSVLFSLDEIADGDSRGFSFEAGGEIVEGFLVRLGDRLFAYRNNCPHTGAPLDWMPDRFLDVKGEYIQCALHGALFEIDTGYCVHGPCVNRSLTPLSIEKKGGQIVLSV